MKIGLIDIEPKIFNTAYIQIADYYRKEGHEVGWWAPLTDRQFDHVFCSSIFDFTDKREVPDRAICGGTGFDVKSRLSSFIEESELDYSIYPKCLTSYIWFSRGCNKDCPWCIIREKEGPIRPVQPKNLNPKGEWITVCDNNFFANPGWRESIRQLRKWGQPVDIQQGIDIDTLDQEKAGQLRLLKRIKRIKIAWDDPHQKDVVPRLKEVAGWFPKGSLMCYVLIGFNSSEDEDLYRVNTLLSIGIDPFVMPFDKSDIYQKNFARYVNHKAILKTVNWLEYMKGVNQKAGGGVVR